MKRFKTFLKKKVVDPILIVAQPVHGKHAQPKKKNIEDKLQEAVVWAGKKFNQPETKKTSAWLKQHDNDHIHHDIDQVGHHLESRHHINDDEHETALKAYTNSSRYVNTFNIEREQAKAGGEKNFVFRKNPETHKILEAKTEKLDAAVNHHTLPDDVHVYHGTHRWNPGQEAAKHPDGLIKMPAYLSTSLNKETAKEFGSVIKYHDLDSDEPYATRHLKHLLHIHVKKGQKGTYIGTRSSIGQEHELLLPRNQTLKIHPKPTVLTDGGRIWHATIHHQE